MVEISLQWPDQTYNCGATSLKTVVKCHAPTLSVFAGPVTYMSMHCNIIQLRSRLIVVSCKGKNKQQACVSSGLHNRYSELFIYCNSIICKHCI